MAPRKSSFRLIWALFLPPPPPSLGILRRQTRSGTSSHLVRHPQKSSRANAKVGEIRQAVVVGGGSDRGKEDERQSLMSSFILFLVLVVRAIDVAAGDGRIETMIVVMDDYAAEARIDD